MIDRLWRWFFNGIVECLATVTGAVLAHPKVQHAAADTMVLAMNQFMVQPDLDEKLLVMNETMSRRHEDFARRTGEDFPKIVGNFLQGMLSSKRTTATITASDISGARSSEKPTLLTPSLSKEEKDDGLVVRSSPPSPTNTSTIFGLRKRVQSSDAS